MLNGTELSKQVAATESKNADSKEINQRRKKRGWRRFIYLEPVLFFYSIGDFMNYTIQQQYVYYRVGEDFGLPVEYMMNASGGCTSTQNSTNSTLWDLERKVQSKAVMINLGITLCIQIPAVIISLFFGAWTDKNGRRPALFSPVTGSIAHCVIQLLVMYLNLSVYLLFLANFLDGCSGYIPTMKQTSMAYIVDISSDSNRIFRVGVLQFLTLMSGVVGYLISGFWIEKFGFEKPVWFILSCQIVCFFYLFLLSESRPKAPDAPNFLSFNSFRTMWSIFAKKRYDSRRKLLILLIACSGVFFLTVLGIDGVITLYYLASPLCFSSVLIGYMFSFYTLAIGAGAVVLTSRLVTRYFSEFKLAVLGAVAVIVSMVWLAFSKYRWMIYVAPIISFSGGVTDPIVKGWMSKIVSPDEEGAMFAMVTTADTIAIIIGMFIFNPIYSVLVEKNFGGGTFLISGALAIAPLVMLCSIRKEIFKLEQKQHTNIQSECGKDNAIELSQCDVNPEKDKITTHL